LQVNIFFPAEALNTPKPQSQDAKEMRFRPPCLFSWEILLNALFTSTQSANERNFRKIVLVQTGNILFLRSGYRLLRLDDFDGVSDARVEAIPRLPQGLIGQIDFAARNRHLLRR